MNTINEENLSYKKDKGNLKDKNETNSSEEEENYNKQIKSKNKYSTPFSKSGDVGSFTNAILKLKVCNTKESNRKSKKIKKINLFIFNLIFYKRK